MTKLEVAILILIVAGFIMWLGYMIPRARVILMSIGFYTLMSGVYASYSNWLPQVKGEVPVEIETTGDVSSMSKEELAEFGEIIIFGRKTGGNPNDGDVGKAQCPLCHTVAGSVRRDRGPDMTAAEPQTKVPVAERGVIRIKEARYQKADFVQAEALPGSGRATNSLEYLAESHVCPSCFVVSGFGNKGTNDRESPMPAVHKAPISLSLDEFVMIDTYMYTKDGLEPPSPDEIKAAYKKFAGDEVQEGPAPGTQTAGGATPVALPAGPAIVTGDDPVDQMVIKNLCFTCHQIPNVPVARIGMVGPMLIEGQNAARRIKSADYKGKAKTPKEYIIESIVHPNAYVVPAFQNPANPAVSPMMQDFAKKFTFEALDKLADFLLTLDCKAAMKDNLPGPPQEPIANVCGGAPQAKASSPAGADQKSESRLQPSLKSEG